MVSGGGIRSNCQMIIDLLNGFKNVEKLLFMVRICVNDRHDTEFSFSVNKKLFSHENSSWKFKQIKARKAVNHKFGVFLHFPVIHQF